MPEQCPCASLDWGNIDQTLPHHPQCDWRYVQTVDSLPTKLEVEGREMPAESGLSGGAQILLIRCLWSDLQQLILDDKGMILTGELEQLGLLDDLRFLDELLNGGHIHLEMAGPFSNSYSLTTKGREDALRLASALPFDERRRVAAFHYDQEERFK